MYGSTVNISGPTPKRTEFNLKGKGTIIISPLLASQIIKLHALCGRDEWSGVLLFTPVNESYKEPENFLLIAEAVFPMNRGNGAYTEYDHNPEDLLTMFDKYPLSDPMRDDHQWRMGHIHSHHYMDTFFTETNMDEVRTNADKHKYYVSLIVNIEGKYTAKVAYVAHRTSKTEGRGDIKFEEGPEEVLVMFDLEVKLQLEGWFNERAGTVCTKKVVTPVHYAGYQGGYPNTYQRSHHTATIPSGKSTTNENQSSEEKIPNENEIGFKRPELPYALKYKVTTDIRENFAKWIFADEKHQQLSFYQVMDKVETLYPTAEQRNGLLGWLLNRFNPWLAENFKEYLTDTDQMKNLDYAIAYRVAEMVNWMDYQHPFAKKLRAALIKRLDKQYRIILFDQEEESEAKMIVQNNSVDQMSLPLDESEFIETQTILNRWHGHATD